MFCPFCGCGAKNVDIPHERYSEALICQNGLCDLCDIPVIVEILSDKEKKERQHASPYNQSEKT